MYSHSRTSFPRTTSPLPIYPSLCVFYTNTCMHAVNYLPLCACVCVCVNPWGAAQSHAHPRVRACVHPNKSSARARARCHKALTYHTVAWPEKCARGHCKVFREPIVGIELDLSPVRAVRCAPVRLCARPPVCIRWKLIKRKLSHAPTSIQTTRPSRPRRTGWGGGR